MGKFGPGPGDGYGGRSSRGHYKGLEAARRRVDKQQRRALRRPSWIRFWASFWGTVAFICVTVLLLWAAGVLK